ncbi:hypothetical protein Tco_0850647 [Tanacetum coccineum]
MFISVTHNAIMEADGEDRAPLLVTYPEVLPKDYHPGRPTETKLETYSIVGENTRKRIDAKVKAVHIVLIGIDNDIYSTVDACANAKEMWIVIECLMLGQSLKEVSYHIVFDILKQHQLEVNELRAKRLVRDANPLIARAPLPPSEFETKVVNNEEDTLRDNEINKLIALISTSFKRIYKPTNNNPRTSSNTRNKNVDYTLRIRYERQTGQYETQWAMYVVGNRDTIACYLYMVKIQEVIPAADKGIGPIFDKDPLEHVHINDEYTAFSMDNENHEQLNLKRMNKSLEASNRVLESSNKALEASKKFLASKLKTYKDMNFVKEARLKCAQANGLVKETKIKSDKKVFAVELELYSTK